MNTLLQDLKVINGELSIPFNPYNMHYTVSLTDSSVTSLEFQYELKEDAQIEILNNNLNNDKTEILVKVFNDDESYTYYITVYKEESQDVSYYDHLVKRLESSTQKEVPKYAVPLISVSCFLLILLFFTLLFKKKKKYR